ncbi:luciferase family protein [Haladaptatus sp. DYF46]|uniref:luciferase domain-containing protein n=1 Tax=Haladaptatus sp. DYF46 TaxID=2886041 RepID=UPI001E4CB296|nr:luciferase family protein [Haladaptatus sp. DYF46]
MNSIESTVSAWSGVEVDSHDRGGGREFTLDGREIGHIHRGKLVDIPFTRRIRDILLEEKLAEMHHVMSDSGWVSYHIQSDEDVDGALWLLRVAYLYHVVTLQNHEEETSTGDMIDIDAALAELDMSASLEDVFNEVRAA